jgi:Rieske [2Fe-2S] domain/FAD dependent oxidoreductase
MYLSCDDAIRSLRPAFVDGEKVLIVGGAGHKMGDVLASKERWDELGSWTDAHFGLSTVTHRWATHDLDPTDRTPFIGALSARSQRRWVATGFGKWGMTNGYVAAHIISTAIGGGVVPWASTFDSTRVASTLNREFVAAGFNAAQGLVVDRITRRGSPRCTHQGCVLRRDEALDTWDCPCHGSRFEMDGSVIQGPAKRSL